MMILKPLPLCVVLALLLLSVAGRPHQHGGGHHGGQPGWGGNHHPSSYVHNMQHPYIHKPAVYTNPMSSTTTAPMHQVTMDNVSKPPETAFGMPMPELTTPVPFTPSTDESNPNIESPVEESPFTIDDEDSTNIESPEEESLTMTDDNMARAGRNLGFFLLPPVRVLPPSSFTYVPVTPWNPPVLVHNPAPLGISAPVYTF